MSKKTVELVSDILGGKASFIDVATAGKNVENGEAFQATAAAANAVEALGAVIKKTVVEAAPAVISKIVGKAAPAAFLLSVAAEADSIN
jgi:hypothetical protein